MSNMKIVCYSLNVLFIKKDKLLEEIFLKINIRIVLGIRMESSYDNNKL